MRRRLYFLVPNAESCKAVVTDLQGNGVPEHHIHVLARDDVALEGVHKANVLQKTELAHGIELGLGVGGVAGMLGGVLAVSFPPAGLVIGGGALIVAATTLLGASFGSLVSVLIASDIPNHELEAFQDAISLGQLLLMVDIPTSQLEYISKLVHFHHPEANIGITQTSERFSQLSTSVTTP